ncbi:macro domain-containing protein [Nitrosomonas sp. Is37]|uniref:macro domain-containing protein n=1 Tax=Nitrosomonas sp. Is37 TaxID=3080535 RepID=UPI00294AC948|nr:macro domain-containing protein [Nitrosomonas sp. Is37]MDV6343786.1 macro domain-containing protein [Nitrosomonas sp. Is37]
MTKREFFGVTIECVQGNIAAQSDMDAIVNAANAMLRMGGGVAGAIHRGAGPGLEEECRKLAPIQPGQAVITGAHNLPNRYVIHCLGPVYGKDEPSDQLLSSCYRNALQLAEDNSIRSIAFSAISTGFFGYPLESATRIAFQTIFDMLPRLLTVKHIRFVLFSKADRQLYEQILGQFAEA